jgi:TetR/AcrR family transcriptional regulator, mexJK operon transcriptional repressor
VVSARSDSLPRCDAADTESAAAASRRGGRPSRLASKQLGELILDAATDLFLTDGYGATSIEAIARRARISKRTFYHRFDDKAALFAAVVHRIIERLRPPANMPLLEGADIEQILQRLAAIILRAVLSPQAIALHRLIVAESARFPQLATVMAEEGSTAEAIALIAGLLEREARAGRLAPHNPTFDAQQFLAMVVAVPQRRALGMGAPFTAGELDAWSHDVVNLFLNGCRGATRATS